MTHNRPENPNTPGHVGLTKNHPTGTGNPGTADPAVKLSALTPHRVTASTITDPDLDRLWGRAEDAEARLAAAADLLETGHSSPLDRARIVRRLCVGEITPEQARAEDRGEQR
nr:hypothetical protein KPHV_29950 [Kitasatospora purpeofusca]